MSTGAPMRTVGGTTLRIMSASSDGDGGVTTEVRGHILLIGLDRPAKYNGVTPEMMDQLIDAYTRLFSLKFSISSIFFLRDPPFICFSRIMAFSGSPKIS